MKILFDIGHPAHVHLFKNLIASLKSSGHQVITVTRNKDITNTLLARYDIDHISISTPGKGFLKMLWELIVRDSQIFRLHLKHRFDMAVGTSVSIGHLSTLTKVRSYTFCEDDDDIIPLIVLAAYPFSTRIINPDCIRHRRFNKRIKYNSFQKLAYLHPDNFTPDPRILEKYDLKPYNFVVFRFSALMAHHDTKARGITPEIRCQIESNLQEYKLIVSTENEKSHDIRPWDMHHILFYAKLLVTDSMSMAVEASVLGVPSIRYNSFVGKSSVLDGLEQKYGLTIGFKPGEQGAVEKMCKKIDAFIKTKNLNGIWQNKRNRMLKENIDLNQWMIHYFNREMKKIS